MSDIAIAMRPKKFEELVGQEKLVSNIRGHFAKKHHPSAWLLSGPTGVGKTTIARIMAVSMQCGHKEVFGSPCSRCRKARKYFDIVEINASDITGIDALRDAVQGANFVPKPGSRRRVYILDEAHQLSKSAQNLLLKYTEDCPRTTKWIVCTTEPDKILSTLRGRCTSYQVPSLGLEGVTELVKRGLEFCNSDRDISDLAEQLMIKGITGGRNILRAVQKYADTDATPEEAAEFGIVTEVNTHALCRAVYVGAWSEVTKLIQDLRDHEEIAEVKGALMGYFRAILLGEEEISGRSQKIAEYIIKLHDIRNEAAPFVAVLLKITKYFEKG